MVSPAANFVGTVVRAYEEYLDDRQRIRPEPKKPELIAQMHEAVPNELAETSAGTFTCDPGFLPKELTPFIANYAPNMVEWLQLTGVFNPSIASPDTEKAIELSAKQKLVSLKDEISGKIDEHMDYLNKLLALQIDPAIDPQLTERQNAMRLANRNLYLFSPDEQIPHVRKQITALENEKTDLETLIAATHRSLGNLIPKTAKEQLLTHIFQTAFNNGIKEDNNDTDAITEEKKRERNERRDQIIATAQKFQPILESGYSSLRKVAIRVIEAVSDLLNNRVFQFCMSLVFAYCGYTIYVAARAAIAQFATQTLAPHIPTVVTFLTTHCPPVVIEAGSVLFGGLNWVMQHQIHLLLFRVGILLGHYLITRRVLPPVWIDLPTRLLILPLRIFLHIFFVFPLSIILFVLNRTHRASQHLSFSVANWGVSEKDRRYKIEEQKALSLWLSMADQVTQKRKEAQEQAAREAAAAASPAPA